MIAKASRISRPEGSGTVLILGLLFFLTGAALLTIGAQPLAALHAFAAFIVLAIVAASNQLIPVLTGAPTASARTIIGVASPLALGFALLVAAFLGAPTFAIAGILLFSGALAWTAWTIGRLARAPLERATRIAVGLALVAFAAASTLGAAMAFALGGSSITGVLDLAPTHAILAIIAFASVVIVTISYRLVPMFALTRRGDRGWGRVPQWFLIVAGFAAAAVATNAPLLRIALCIVFVAGAGAGFLHVQSVRARMRRHLDMSIRYAGVAWGFAAGSLLLAIGATWTPAAATPAVICAVLGWLNVSILGYAYKIAGFLCWQIAKERNSVAKLPPLGTAVPERPAAIALALLSFGTIAIAYALGSTPQFAFVGVVVYSLGAVCAVATLARVPLTYLRIAPATAA